MSDGRVELWAANPLGRFSDRADDYARYRPTYPAAAIDAVLKGLGAQVVAVDVGAGTGISGALLAERGGRGIRVIAIEPNAAMRETGARFIAGRGLASRVEWPEGTAEATGLATGSADLVLCAQAFHWFRAEEALAEFARVLRPGGRLALVWNDKDLRDELTRGYGELVEEASGHDPAAADHVRPEALDRSPLFAGVRQLRFTHEQRLDAAGLQGRAMSASYVPKIGPAAETLARGLRTLHARFADGKGEVRLVYETVVYVGERR